MTVMVLLISRKKRKMGHKSLNKDLNYIFSDVKNNKIQINNEPIYRYPHTSQKVPSNNQPVK